MRKAPALVLAVALVLASGVLSERARAATSEAGGTTDARSDRDRAPRLDALTQSLRRALHGGAIADVNQDGMVSRDEAMRYLEGRFARMDADLDGVLGVNEFVRAGLSRAPRARFDRPRPAGFEAADLDGNGRLSPEEFLQAARVRQAAEQREAREGARLTTYRHLDVDGDGRVTRDDFMAAGAGRFAASDTNGDGLVPIWQFLAALRF